MKHILYIGWLYLIICFSSLFLQFKNAGIIEMEASIKACRVLIMQQVRVVNILQYQFNVFIKSNYTVAFPNTFRAIFSGTTDA